MMISRRNNTWPLAVSFFVSFVFFVVNSSALQAHPVPRRSHDRTIMVRLTADAKSERIAVRVDYRLEVDEFTVVFDDLPAVGAQAELSTLRKPQEFYETFTRCYAPLLAANLLAKLDGQPLEFRCSKHGHTLRDESGNPLGHLRCDFVFEATALPLKAGSSSLHLFSLKEGNYELEEGQIRLSLFGTEAIKLVHKTEPDVKLKTLAASQLQPGDDARLRNVQATFSLAPSPQATPATRGAENSGEQTVLPGTTVAAEPEVGETPNGRAGLPNLYELFRDEKYGFWVLLCLSAAFGAVHALTPGHGKTLVAAYLVGERGTIAHAFLLGLVTTLTHTGVVIAIAIALRISFPQGGMSDAAKQDLQMALGLGGGLLVAGLGIWLLLRRLTGQADHFHMRGHGHHHHGPHDHDHHHAEHGHDHSCADHYHDELGRIQPLAADTEPVGWWGLVILGVSGGMVPCWDAILMLLVAVSTNLLWLALPLLLAFSAGLAGVLILIGILVVRVKGFAGSRWGQSRLFRALPVISAVLVTALGLWLCYDSVYAKAAPSAISVHARP